MFKHVLVPLDGSVLAENALPTARHVLIPEGTLTLLSVIDLAKPNTARLYDIPITSDYERHRQDLILARQNIHAYLRRLIAIQHLPPTITTQFRVCTGNPASLISELARALRVDAIVMSMHERSGVNRWMTASITKQVLRLSQCPVVVVPEQITVPVQPLLHAAPAAAL